jgi:hypothetical protein
MEARAVCNNTTTMRKNFYCQQKCGEVDFSIDEWNRTQEEIKQLTPEQKDFVMQATPICQKQCKECSEIVLETQNKNRAIRESKSGHQANAQEGQK